MGLAVAAAVVGLFFLFTILVTLLYKGFTAISPTHVPRVARRLPATMAA